jgi:4-alpha-glucanotransferase
MDFTGMDFSAVLHRLGEAAGIENHYWDMHGTRHDTTAATLQALLGAFGVAAGTEAEARASLDALAAVPWQMPLPPVLVLHEGEPVTVPLRLPVEDEGRTIRWSLRLEQGGERSGEIGAGDLFPEETFSLDGRAIGLRRLRLAPLPVGYHDLVVQDREPASMRLIVAPRRCYVPPRLASRRAWGLMLQLYSLKSQDDWGIGDFTGLKMLIEKVAAADGDAIGLNPLHTLFLDTPEDASPYSPCSRLFRNPLYLDLTAIPDFAESELARAVVQSDSFRHALETGRSAELVRYREVERLKRPVLEILWEHFLANHGEDARGAAFRDYVAKGGRDLECLATFQALAEQYQTHDWSRWPLRHQDQNSPATAEFRASHSERIGFFQYLQWQCEEQFASAAALAKSRGMAVGLYNDLAVSVDAASADHWAHQKQFAGGARVGAPPDPFNEKGQDWGVVPLNPLRLRETAFDYFRALLSANMRHAGALRIDHVMGMTRLFLIPPGAKATDGAYVRYPLTELLAITALESQRHRCLVIGEDLGTVPAGFRERLAEAEIYSSRVLYFEREHDAFKPPATYPGAAAVSVSTHDLATFHGFWQGDDIAAKSGLGLFKNAEEERGARELRVHDRRKLLEALAAEGLLPEGLSPDGAAQTVWTPQLTAAVHAYLARSPASLFMVQMDDYAGVLHQANLPGSIMEYPNWRRRLMRSIEEFGADPAFQDAMRAVAAARCR